MGRTPKERAAQIARNRLQAAQEIVWEAEMTERIAEMREVIKAENLEIKRLEGNRHFEERENQHHHWRGDLPSGIDFD